jgi:ABC-type multidrug transport system fused ATPase/permease subunit
MGIAQYSQSLVSCRRMLDFFDSSELIEYVDHRMGAEGVIVEMKEASLGWILPEDAALLEEKEGKKGGETGAGGPAKSTLQDKKVTLEAIESEYQKRKEERETVAGETTPTKLKRLFSGKSYSKLDENTPVAVPTADEGKKKEEKKSDKLDELEAGKGVNINVRVNNSEPLSISTEGIELTTISAHPSPSATGAADGAPKDLIHRSVHTLRNLTFSVKEGELVGIVGSVGSGKSSVLAALLGEMHCQSGFVRTAGSVAYCDQRPWILNDTVQGNILFGKPYNEQAFDMALYAANLEDDIKVLPGGINTQIGKIIIESN